MEAFAAHRAVFVVLVPVVAVETDLIALVGDVSKATFISDHFAVVALETVITAKLVSVAQGTAGTVQYTVCVHKSLAVCTADHLCAVLVPQAVLALSAVGTDPHRRLDLAEVLERGAAGSGTFQTVFVIHFFAVSAVQVLEDRQRELTFAALPAG